MLRVSRLSAAGLIAIASSGMGCTRRASEPTERRTSPVDEATSSSAAPSPQVPRSSDLELIGEPTVSGPIATDTLLRDARLLIPSMRPCIGTMPAGASFGLSLSVDDVGLLRGIRFLPDSPSDASAAGCIEAALVRNRVSHALESGARAEVSLRFRTVARAGGVSVDASRMCNADDECVFVHGDCRAPYAIHRAHAAEIDAASRRRTEASGCPSTAGDEASAHRLACVAGTCESVDETHGELRRCTAASQCVTLVLENGRFTAVAKRSVAAATDQLVARTPLPSENAPSPSCQYGVCLLGWSGED